jgi:hypothetical protein
MSQNASGSWAGTYGFDTVVVVVEKGFDGAIRLGVVWVDFDQSILQMWYIFPEI